MVHALTEAHRVLRPRGYLIDYRPDLDPAGRRAKALELYCRRGRDVTPVGHLIETTQYYRDYVAANRAVQLVLRRGLFTLISSELSRPLAYFRSPDVLRTYLATNWPGTTLPADTAHRVRSLVRRHPTAEIMVVEVFRINVLHKT